MGSTNPPKIPSWAGVPANDAFELENTKKDDPLSKPAVVKLSGRSHAILGRSSVEATVKLECATASRVHALLVHHKDEGQVYVIDLKSAHGTYIDGKRLVPDEPEVLRTGQNLRFGSTDAGASFVVKFAPGKQKAGAAAAGGGGSSSTAAGAGGGRDVKDVKKEYKEKDVSSKNKDKKDVKVKDTHTDIKSDSKGRVRCSHILVKYQGSRDPVSFRDKDGKIIGKRTREEAMMMLRGYIRDMRRGEIGGSRRGFTYLASRVSDCDTGQPGRMDSKGREREAGDLGYIDSAAPAIDPKLAARASALQIDEMSEPLESEAGLHIFLRTA